MDRHFLKNYLANLQVSPLVAAYTQCWPEWHDYDYTPDYNKFYFICGGEGWLKIGDAEYTPHAGELCLMPAGVRQSYAAVGSDPFRKYWCHFQARIGERNLFDILKTPYIVQVKQPEAMTHLFRDLVAWYGRNDLPALLHARAALLKIIAVFLEHAPAESLQNIATADYERLAPVLRHIDAHLAEPITIDDLALLAHFHPTHFIRFFRRQTGTTPMHYIRGARLERSKHLLQTTGLSVSRIASALGFSSQFHFSREFKAYTGYAPTEYRKAMQP